MLAVLGGIVCVLRKHRVRDASCLLLAACGAGKGLVSRQGRIGGTIAHKIFVTTSGFVCAESLIRLLRWKQAARTLGRREAG